MIVGLTGGIGTGKSTVSRILREKGFSVIDLDIISREVIVYPEIIDKITENFGLEVLEKVSVKECKELDTRKISRNKLGQIVFKDEKKLSILNSIMHPVIIKKMKDEIKEIQKTCKIVFVEVQLLFEINIEKEFDMIVLVYSDRENQLKRIVQRDGRDKSQALDIINSQMDMEEKIKKSDYIIDNNGDLENLEKSVEKFLKEMKNYF